MLEIHVLAKNRDGVLAASRALASSVKRTGEHRKGAQVLRGAISRYPEEPPLLHDLAELLIASNQADLAVDCLKSVNAIHERNGDIKRQLKTYELIVRIDPSEKATLKQLQSQSERSRIRLSDLIRTSSIASVTTAILVVLAYLGFNEIDSRRVYAESEKAMHTQLRFHHYDRARETVQDFLSAYQFSTRKRAATTLISHIRSEERDHHTNVANARSELTRVLGMTLYRAEHAANNGKHREAHEELSRGMRAVAAYKGRMNQEILDKHGRVKALLERVEAYLGGAKQLLAQIVRARKREQLDVAHRQSLELLHRYPKSKEALGVRIGVRVESTPPGATVIMEKKRIGKTPVVVDLPPNRSIITDLDLPGFRPARLQVRPAEEYRVHIGLEKVPTWVFESGGPIDSMPAATGDRILVGNRDGRMFCLDHDGRKKWNEYQVRLDISGGIAIRKNIACFGSFDGNLYTLNTATGTPLRRAIQATSVNAAIKLAPSEVSREGVVAFNAGNRFLVGVDMATGRRKWRRESPVTLAGSPQLDGGSVFCFTRQQQLLEFELSKGRLRSRLKLHGVIARPGRVVNGVAYVGTANADVSAIDVRSGKSLWSTKLVSRTAAPPTISTEARAVIVPLENDQLVCLDARTGTVRWKRSLDDEVRRTTGPDNETRVGAIETDGVCDDKRFYVGTLGGYILCWRIREGRIEWTYRTKGATQSPVKGIETRGMLRHRLFLQGSDDGNLYAFAVLP